MRLNSQNIQQSINKIRKEEKIRILWPDYEVYDLLQFGLSLYSIPFLTSNPVRIVRLHNGCQNEEILKSKAYTHVAVHTIDEFNDKLELKPVHYAILSHRGLAIDEFNCRYVRGIYLVSVIVAQIDRQIFFWGCQSATTDIKIFGPRYIAKKNSMWILEFQSDKPLSSIFFYTTKREPRFGKSHYLQDNQLPKDVKLQICMKPRCFQSFLEAQMNKQQKLIEFPYFIKGPMSKQVVFGQQNEFKQNITLKTKQQKMKVGQIKSINKSQTKKQQIKQIVVKILHTHSLFQIHRVNLKYNVYDLLDEIKDYKNKNQAIVFEAIQTNNLTEQFNKLIKIIEEAQLSLRKEKDEKKIWIQMAKNIGINMLQQIIFTILIINFIENKYKNLDQWQQLMNLTDCFKSKEKQQFIKWLVCILSAFCIQLLKDCQQYAYDQIKMPKQQLIAIITHSLLDNCQDCSKVSDLLFILMRVQSKTDIFQLYRNYAPTQSPVIIHPSFKDWQRQQHFYESDQNDIIYVCDKNFPKIDISNYFKERQQQIVNFLDFDYTLQISYHQFYNNYFLSGKIINIGNYSFKYYLYRKQDLIFCFLEQILQINQSYQQKFTSLNIQIELTINNQKKINHMNWSFILPSLSVGKAFSFSSLSDKTQISCKISFKRCIVHECLLNYFRIRYEQLIRMQNKCSQKIEAQNKKLLKRRSSLFLERSLVQANCFQAISQQCYLHQFCEKCESLCGQSSIYGLNRYDLYQLMLNAPFREETDAFLVTLKYLIMKPNEIQNKNFWFSQIRIKHLKLSYLLKIFNKHAFHSQVYQMLRSLILRKIQQIGLANGNETDNWAFLREKQSRIGKSMWRQIQEDYSEQYLIYLKNAQRL